MNFRLFILDIVRGLNQKKIYNDIVTQQYNVSSADIEKYSKEKFNEIFKFHVKNNSEYLRFLESKNYKFNNNFSIEDIPILTKSDLKTMNPVLSKYVHKLTHTGGSTGSPFSYSLSKESLGYMWPNLWRAFDVCDIKPCEKLLMIAGPSLFNNRSLIRRSYDFVANFKVVSAFDLNDANMNKAVALIKKHKIKGIYGYTSSVFSFLQFMKKNSIHLNLNGIFTTSESFIPSIRELAKEYCSCDVIDIYGANDGGICAFNCKENNGYHISYERTFLEIVDKKIILTDLLNTSYPFIRYEVGDLAHSDEIIKEKCACGRSLYRIKGISGRINSQVHDIDGNAIHTEFFTHIFSRDNNIMQFQLIETSENLIINFISDSQDLQYFNEKYRPLIERKLKRKFVFEVNSTIRTLPNKKVPILFNE